MTSLRQRLRHERYDEIHFSPHMDDTAYSCGGRVLQRRAQGARILVVTVFGNGQSELTESGGGTFADYKKRVAEEEAVMERLDVDYMLLNRPELIFRKNSAGDLMRFVFPFMQLKGPLLDELFVLIMELLQRHLAVDGEVFFPLSMGFHPDHRVLFDVGRAVHALALYRVQFYEDVPYSLVPSLRALRLDYLGVPVSVSIFSATRQINRFLFNKFGFLLYIGWLPLFFYLLSLTVLRTILNAQDRKSGEPPPKRDTRDISDVLSAKAEVMRLYPSQTAFFFTLDEQLPSLLLDEGKSVEHSWQFPKFDNREARLSPAQQSFVAASVEKSVRP